MPRSSPPAVPNELIEQKIYLIRGHKVMLDSDLAELYRVTTGNLNLAVRRNPKRFPEDFMFQLSREETQSLLLQNARAEQHKVFSQLADHRGVVNSLMLTSAGTKRSPRTGGFRRRPGGNRLVLRHDLLPL